MGEHKQEFLLVWSGVGAFVFYSIVVFVLLLTLSPIFMTKYAPRADTMIEQMVAIDLTSIEIPQDNKKDSGTHLEGTGIKDIFSTIPDMTASAKESGDDRSVNAKNTRDKKDSSKLQAIQQQLEKLNSNLSAMENRTLDVQSQTISPEFADGEYNEWFGKIYDIIYRKWQSKYYQDAEVSVLLRITNTGSFYYRVTKLSPYEDYNQSVIDLLESLKQDRLPPYPKGRVIEIEVNFRLK